LAKELAIHCLNKATLILTSSNESLLKDVAAELNYSKVYILPYNLLNIDGLPDLVSRALALPLIAEAAHEKYKRH
jgi:hypothetical protein